MTVARIIEEQRKTTQSGKALQGLWTLEFERQEPQRPDPLKRKRAFGRVHLPGGIAEPIERMRHAEQQLPQPRPARSRCSKDSRNGATS